MNDQLGADPPRARSAWLDRAGRAGAVAALAMLFVQLLWRLVWSSDGAPAFPEIIVAAVARLTPLGIFGFMTENLGSLAQNTLFAVVLLAIVGIGYEAGGFAGRLSRLGRSFGGRLAGGLVVAAALLLFTLLVVLPIARFGIFGSASRNGGEMVLQLAVTFAIYGVAWALVARPLPATAGEAGTATGAADAAIDRRSVLSRLAWGGGTLALLAGVGGLSWRLIAPRPTATDAAASEAAAREIAATARARADTVAAAPAPAPGAVPVAAEPANAAAQPEAQAESGEPWPATIASPEELTAVIQRLESEQRLTPILTSVADFYHVSKNISDPVVDGEGWTLTIDGLVQNPLTLTYEQLFARATTRKITTLCCISNELNGDLVGTAEWQGVPLVELLAQAGVKPEAVDLKFRCADDYEDSIPVAQGFDADTLVVIGMNGEPLPPDHGYPARLIVPPIYGMKNVKWVERIEAVDHDFQGYWQTRGWSDPAPYQIWGRIDTPRSGDKLNPGTAMAAGLASAGDRGITRVEVSLDGGATWADATLEPALNAPFTWVRWVFPFAATPGKQELWIRATDGTGAVAPEERRPPLPDGATGWPRRSFNVEEA